MTTLDYHSPQTRRRRWAWPPWQVLLVTGVPLLLRMLSGVEVRQVRGRVDAVTGSIEWQTTWLWKIKTSQRVDVSPLETRMTKIGLTHTRDWRFLHNTHRTLFGSATCYECGSAPPIYELRPALDLFVQAVTDEQLRQFIQVMQIGTEAQQKDAVKDAEGSALRQ